jgi:hypothetical protein
MWKDQIKKNNITLKKIEGWKQKRGNNEWTFYYLSHLVFFNLI